MKLYNNRDLLEVYLTNEQDARYSVAVIGAGPAGLFAARELASRGIETILFNRDIKPGGLAEYGIYPNKYRMKEGLRNQFRQILAMPAISYYGNVVIGEQGDFSIPCLRDMGFQAILVAVGAQSTKRLGISGEDFAGVYHAKDIVYHYNLLPPFSETTYQIGKRVAVVGAGNVMMDITRWLIEEQEADEVIAIARRGPAEVKFDRKELESIIQYLDFDALNQELARVEPHMRAIGQDPGEFFTMIQDAYRKAGHPQHVPRFKLRFLSSPAQILGERASVAGLQVEENNLVVGDDGQIRAKGTGRTSVLEIDTVIFAIGDVVDSAIGVPVQFGEYAINPQPRFPIEGISYEAYDPQSGQAIPDIFFAGWARRPSIGLVGVARKDATNAAQAVAEYLQTLTPLSYSVDEQVREQLRKLQHPVVDRLAAQRLDAIERERAGETNQPYFKFPSNAEMLEILGLTSAEEN